MSDYTVLITEKLKATQKNIKFCNEIAEQINKSYPDVQNVAAVILIEYLNQVCVKITQAHSDFCRWYVKLHCRIKSFENIK